MFRRSFLIAMVVLTIIALGCSSKGSNPMAPGSDLTADGVQGTPTQTHLWGLYDVYVDIPTQTATAVVDRTAMFAANVVQFLNGNPLNLGFLVNGTPIQPTYIDVDIDVTIKHPLSGLPQYNGYDVRGIFMGDGHGTMKYSSLLKYPKANTDQILLPSPVTGFGGADGYTRWFNKHEFTTPGLFGYTPGMYATPDYSPTATLCPYKYFADGLGKTQDIGAWLKANPTTNGIFTSGTSNTRNYYIRFPNAVGIKFAYAVVANWKGELPADHPAPAPEAVGVSVVDTSDVYYISAGNNGGDIKLEFDLFDWQSAPSTIIIESTVLTANHTFTAPEMIPIGSGPNYSTYSVDIPATAVTSTGGNEYWIIAKYSGSNYKNTFGVTNLAGNDSLAAFFRYNLTVVPNVKPVCDLDVVEAQPQGGFGPQTTHFDASGTTDPGDTVTFTWDFDGDNVFGETPDDDYTGAQDKPAHIYTTAFNGDVHVKATDTFNFYTICAVPVNVTPGPYKNININFSGAVGSDIAMDPTTGDAMVIYSNGQVRRYLYSKAYTSFTTASNIGNTYFKWIDVGVDGYWVVQGNDTGYERSRHYTPADAFIAEPTQGSWGGNIPNSNDVACMFNVGTMANQHIVMFGHYDGASGTTIYYTDISGILNPGFGVGWTWDYNGLTSDGYGAAKPYYGWIRGTEASPSGDFLWTLESTDCYAAKYNIAGLSLAYTGCAFGTGTPTNGDNGVNNPRDITVAKTGPDKYFIIDRSSTGAFSIKGFIDNGATTSQLASFVQTPAFAQAPIRLDGCPNLSRMLVLMTAGSNTSMSLFLGTELP